MDVHFPPDFVVHEQAPLGRHAGPQSFHTESSSDSDSLPASLYFEGNSPVPQKSSDSRHISEEPRSFLLRMHALLSPFDSQVESQSVPADAVQPGLGTWANRQRVFLQESAEKEPGNYVQNIDESGPSGVQYFNSDGATPGAQDHNPVEDVASAGTYTADMHDAWRWRFTRKWQVRYLISGHILIALFRIIRGCLSCSIFLSLRCIFADGAVEASNRDNPIERRGRR